MDKSLCTLRSATSFVSEVHVFGQHGIHARHLFLQMFTSIPRTRRLEPNCYLLSHSCQQFLQLQLSNVIIKYDVRQASNKHRSTSRLSNRCVACHKCKIKRKEKRFDYSKLNPIGDSVSVSKLVHVYAIYQSLYDYYNSLLSKVRSGSSVRDRYYLIRMQPFMTVCDVLGFLTILFLRK